MVSYVINVRIEQVDAQSGALHLPRFSLPAALEAAGHEILLFASRDEGSPGYFGTAMAGDPVPLLSDKARYRLPLYNQQRLARVVTLSELHALAVEEMPFHTYSRPIRPIADAEHEGLVTMGAIPSGFGEMEIPLFNRTPAHRERVQRVQDRQLRFEMIDAYGAECVFMRKRFPDLSGLRYGVDVGHLWPRYAGGPDIIQNVLPMSKDVNWQWDQGLISLEDSGDLMIADKAGDDTRSLFANFRRIKFPDIVQQWPNAQYLKRHRDEIFEKGPKWLDYPRR